MSSAQVSRRRAIGTAFAGAVGWVSAATLGDVPAHAATSRQRTVGVRERAASSACPSEDPATPKRQLRGVWIASVDNIDWPSTPGLSATRQQEELIALYDEAARLGLNAVFVQVRPTADAFWPSPYEPWSHWLTGTQGAAPGYDPLAFAVAEAHRRNLEFHGWFNPYRITMEGTDLTALVPDHPARQHPEWVVAYGGKLYYNPGLPAVRAFVQDAIADAVTRYDIDGVHFDDYFYPYPVEGEEFDDDAAFAEYGGDFAERADWRRDNVDLLIRELGQRVHAAKPWMRFGVSPFGVWRNADTDPDGSATQAGVQTYDDLYADTRRWVQRRWIDYIVPQVYWQIGHPEADYATLTAWWAEQVRDTGVGLWIGQASYKVGDPAQPAEWHDPGEMSRHLSFNRDHSEAGGDVYFSAAVLVEDPLGHIELVRGRHYSRPALAPVLPTLDGRAPRAPLHLSARHTPEGVELSWVDPGAALPTRARVTAYAVYRLAGEQGGGQGGEVDPCEFADAGNLVAVPRAGTGPRQRFTDPNAQPGTRYTYVVTALNRWQRESGPTPAEAVTTG